LIGWFKRFRKPDPDAFAARIRESFETAAADEEHFPSTIDPRILHVRVILEALQSTPQARVLDLGCGKGRFARIVAAEYPQARVFASDLALNMLRAAPPELSRVAATMLKLPFTNEAFDFIYATESLEHAVDIPAAVAEMCRVLKPGGRLIVIDKNKDHWGRLETPEWETWFDRRQLERTIARHCRTVRSDFISYWEDVAPDGLFLVWSATK
jgi:malonyl-CoA O-methyltransferase